VNWLDFLIIALVAASVISSIINGLTRELVRLAAVVLGLLMALWWYPLPARYIEPYTSAPAVAGFVGFLAIFIAFLILGSVVSWLLGKLLDAAGLRWFDRILGAAFGLVRGMLVSAALLMGIVAFAPGKGPIEAVAGSRLAPSVLYGAGVLIWVAPRRLKDGFQEGMKQVRKMWGEFPADTV
jgi:membrane protein required for colicin V production